MSYSNEIKRFLEEHPYQTIQVGSAVFRYVIAGNENDPCIVFLNGGMNCSEMWFKYVEKMSAYCRTLIFDYPPQFNTLDDAAAAMRAFFESLGISKAFFAGASFGGLMAQLFARKYPDIVSGLGLFSTAGLDDHTIRASKKKYRMLPLLLWYMKRCNYEKLKPRLINGSLKNYAKDESPEDQQYLREMFEYMFCDYTREKDIHITGLMAQVINIEPCTRADFDFIKGRVLLIFPEKDFFSSEEQTSLKDLFPDARVEYIKNGHFGTVLEYDKYICLIRQILEL